MSQLINAILATSAALLVSSVYLVKFDMGFSLGFKDFMILNDLSFKAKKRAPSPCCCARKCR